MPVWNSWTAECDSCRRPGPQTGFDQSYLLESLRKAGWKYKRVLKPNGYTKLIVTCPTCLTKPKES